MMMLPNLFTGATRLTTPDFIAELFCRVDDALPETRKDVRANLWPSEIVTLGMLFVLKGKSARTFYRWLERDCLPLFPRLPERTRLFRVLAGHQALAQRFLAEPTLVGLCDTFGVELIHPKREGRSAKQVGRKGLSNHRWIVGVKWCALLNSRGEVVDWEADTANVHDSHFQASLLSRHASGGSGMGVFVDGGFHKSEKRGGDLANLVVCEKGENNIRMVIETLFSQVSGVFAMKKIAQRTWPYITARLGFAAALYNLLIRWQGHLTTDEKGYVQLGIAQFSL